MTGRAKDVLVVENDANDAEFICRAFAKAAQGLRVNVCRNLKEAKDYLEKADGGGEGSERLLPAFIVSDNRIDDGSGFELAAWVRNRGLPSARIPFVILTGSLMLNKECEAEELRINEVVEKPDRFEELVALARRLVQQFGAEGMRVEHESSGFGR